MPVLQTFIPDMPMADKPRAVALGVFDGVHLGHRAVLSSVCGIPCPDSSSLLTATALSIVGVPKSGARLTDDDTELDLCNTLGIDEWLQLPFDRIASMSPQTFVENILYRQLHAQVVCCGENYRFGHGGTATAQTLRELCRPLGIRVIVVPMIKKDGAPISATRIRNALAQGDMAQVAACLGRPYAVRGTVAQGNRIGRTLGFPTVNQPLSPTFALPRFGVYASLTVIDGVQHFAVTNIGVHPSVGCADTPQAETWIADFDGDLYGQTVTVQLIAFLREERAFASVDELKTAIEADKQAALKYLRGDKDGAVGAVFFDFDDTLQDRHAAFLEVAKRLTLRHCPDIDEHPLNERAEWMLTQNNHGYVNYNAYFENVFQRFDWGNCASAAQLEREYFITFPDCTILFDKTVEVLTALKERGYRVGVITNGTRLLQNRKLDLCGLRPLLDAVIVSGDEKVHKPDPELFYRAAARFGLSPQQCVYVGDYPKNDIAGALASGMRPIYIRQPHFDCPYDVPAVDTVEDVLPILT